MLYNNLQLLKVPARVIENIYARAIMHAFMFMKTVVHVIFIISCIVREGKNDSRAV